MKKTDIKYKSYVQILKEELVPAMGCTEPIAIAYASAKAREVLGSLPERVVIYASANIIKNVKSVVVPNTNSLKGIEAAAAAGIIAGNSEKKLEVLSNVNEEEKTKIKDYLGNNIIKVNLANNQFIFYIEVNVYYKDSHAVVRIANHHTNIVYIEKDKNVLFEKDAEVVKDGLTDKKLLNVEDIIDFADTVAIEDISEVIGRQIEYNSRISEEGLKNSYGANIGKVLLSSNDNNVKTRAKAKAAAGSDARMSGCELPVVIVSGSGNQGMTASLPVIEYAKELQVSKEKLYRALVLSNLITIHQKTGIGRLSAYCGAVSAGCGSGAAIAYLHGGGYKEIAHTIVNSLAIVSGIICDGAKASCAAKIAAAVDAGILGYNMYQSGQEFYGGDGIVTKGVEETITNVGRLAKDGMGQTDKEIINIMIGEKK